MAVCGFLLGVAPMAILANGNRIIPVLIANRYDGRGRGSLSVSQFGRLTMPGAAVSLILSWVTLQGGILGGNVVAIQVGGLLLIGTALCLASTVLKQGLTARHEADSPRWTMAPTSTDSGA